MKAKLLLLLAVIFWGWSFVFTKVMLEVITPVEVMGLRFLIGLPFLYLVLRAKKLTLKFDKKDYRPIIIGSLILTAHFLIQVTGLQYTSATNTGWIISVTPLVMAILAVLILKEKLSGKVITGIIVATIGIFLLVSDGNLTDIAWLKSTGDWLVLLSAHTWAIFTVATRDISRNYQPLKVTFAVLFPAALLMVGYMLFTSDWVSFLSFSTEVIIAWIILGVFCLVIAHWFWQEGVAELGAAKAGIFLYLEPLATTALAVPYLNEHFGLFTALGGLIVLIGVFIAEKKSP